MTPTPQRRKTRFMMIAAAVLLVTGFLLGFIPQFRSASGLRDELRGRDERIQHLEREAKLSRARSLASLLYLELNRRNYGTAAQHATALFDQLRGMLADASPEMRSSIEKLLSQRDAIMAGIAKTDAAAADLAQQTLDQLHQLKYPEPGQ